MYRIFIIVGIVALAIAGVLFAMFSGGGESEYEYAVAERGVVERVVSMTGRVKAVARADLAFELAGRVQSVHVSVGDTVARGDVLVELDQKEDLAKLAEARAAAEVARSKLAQLEAVFASETARLAELERGTRPEEIAVQQTKLNNAKIALDDTAEDLVDKLNDAFTRSDDAVRSKADQFFSNPRSGNPQVAFAVASSAVETDLESRRLALEGVLNNWGMDAQMLVISDDLAAAILIADAHLSTVSAFLAQAAVALGDSAGSASYSQATIDGWRADISSARASVNTAIINLSAAEEAWRAARSDVLLKEQELLLLEAGTVPEKVEAQRATVRQAEADLAAQRAAIAQADAGVLKIEAGIGKRLLRSPISGAITRQDARIGEIAAANAVLVSVISAGDFEIEANVPEVDIPHVALDSRADVTLDAYGASEIFSALVERIDPGETIIEGVPTYEIALHFEEPDPRIRAGMTANADIISERREGVVRVPRRAVFTRDGQEYVRVLDEAHAMREQPVRSGLNGSDGSVEIIAGVEEGEKVITYFPQ